MADQPPGYLWAIHADPDLVVVQFPLVPVFAGDEPRDAMRTLLERRGFQPVSRVPELDLRPANGCAVTGTGPGHAELVIRLADDGRASRIPLPHGDPAWGARVHEAGQVPVLVTVAAVDDDGTTTRERLQRDVEAGGVLAALVPAGDLTP